MSKAESLAKAAQQSAALLSSPVPSERKKVFETLKMYALRGEVEFERYVTATERLLALASGHPGPISLARMQKEKVQGASTFYTYVLGLRPLIRTDNIEGIQSATASWVTSKPPPTDRQVLRQALLKIKASHMRGELTDADYAMLATVKKKT